MKKIKHTIFNSINTNLFEKNFIVDLDLRSSGIVLNKKSFLNLEINFYLNEKNLDFKSNYIKENVKDITKKIVQENLSNNQYFIFTLTKKDKIDL